MTALLWPTHQHHEAAQSWFAGQPHGWATCALTQLGFVRIVSNPGFSPQALTPDRAIEAMGRNLEHPRHEFWADALQLPAAVRLLERRLTGHKQLTDAYLLALAIERRGVLATFDRGISEMAGSVWSSAVSLVPAG